MEISVLVSSVVDLARLDYTVGLGPRKPVTLRPDPMGSNVPASTLSATQTAENDGNIVIYYRKNTKKKEKQSHAFPLFPGTFQFYIEVSIERADVSKLGKQAAECGDRTS